MCFLLFYWPQHFQMHWVRLISSLLLFSPHRQCLHFFYFSLFFFFFTSPMKTNMASEYSHLVLFMYTVLLTHTSVCEHMCMYTCLCTCTYMLYTYMYIHIIYMCMLSTTVTTSKITILNISLLITFFHFSKWLIPVFSHHLFTHHYFSQIYWHYQWISLSLPVSSFSGFPESSVGKESTCSAGDLGSIPVSGRTTGDGIGYPL